MLDENETQTNDTDESITIKVKRDVVDRRTGLERRQQSAAESGYTGPENREADRRTGLERRRGAGIRCCDIWPTSTGSA